MQKINDHMEDLKFESEDLYSSEGAERWLRELDWKESQWHIIPLFCGCQTRNPQYYMVSTSAAVLMARTELIMHQVYMAS